MPFEFKINIAPIKEQVGQTLQQTTELKLPDYSGVKFPDPWVIHTRINHTYDGYYVTGQAEGLFTTCCDRCLEPYTSRLTAEFSQIFASQQDLSKDNALASYKVSSKNQRANDGLTAKEPVEDEKIQYFSGDVLDLAETLWDSVVLSLPMKYLCAEECKGLCAQCGANLNITTCKCESNYLDPRLAKLGELFNLAADRGLAVNKDEGGGSDGQPKK
ncbi:MAG TPA: DUF177 domain-containing protein [Bacillota bacterium]